jgi:hypothetical protein
VKGGGEADVRARNYEDAATLEDRFNKEALPKVMQVKNFGKKGGTKYTHLADQDTTLPHGGGTGGVAGFAGAASGGIGGGSRLFSSSAGLAGGQSLNGWASSDP